jgi:hypothetical protein
MAKPHEHWHVQANAWSLCRWFGLLHRVRDVFRAAEGRWYASAGSCTGSRMTEHHGHNQRHCLEGQRSPSWALTSPRSSGAGCSSIPHGGSIAHREVSGTLGMLHKDRHRSQRRRLRPRDRFNQRPVLDHRWRSPPAQPGMLEHSFNLYR